MKGFIELTWLTYRYPDKPKPVEQDYPTIAAFNNAYKTWFGDREDRSVEPGILRAVSTIDVRDILEVAGPGFVGKRAATGCQITRHSEPVSPLEDPRALDVEESYEEVKRRIAEATAP